MTAEIVNLRGFRKRTQRRKDEKNAAARRVAHGTPKAVRQEIEARRARTERNLDGHRLDPDDE
jgi:hypothetical protein